MDSGSTIKVFIADDHPVIRMRLAQYLKRSPDICVVGEADNGQDAIRFAQELAPDVLLLDVFMPGLDGLDVVKTLHPRMPDLKILMLSVIDDRLLISDLIALGAWAYFLKDEAPSGLVDGVRQAALGNGQGRRPAHTLPRAM